jgi:hypothetical protein
MENTMTQNKNISTLLGWMVALQALVLVGQWTGNGWTSRAAAQIPDAGAQHAEMIDQLKHTNVKLDRIIELLESGKVQVHAVVPDEKAGK